MFRNVSLNHSGEDFYFPGEMSLYFWAKGDGFHFSPVVLSQAELKQQDSI